MNWKYLPVIAILLLLCSSAFAVNPLVVSTPGTVNTGTNAVLSFVLYDGNSEVNRDAFPDQLRIYYSTVSGAKQNLIVMDTNLRDAQRVICSPDYNFATARNCYYNWSVPTTLSPGYYYIDYNFLVKPGDTNFLESTTAFKVEQVLGCGTLVWVAGIFALLLCFVGLMRLLQGQMNMQVMIALAIGIMIAIYIIISITSGVCVL